MGLITDYDLLDRRCILNGHIDVVQSKIAELHEERKSNPYKIKGLVAPFFSPLVAVAEQLSKQHDIVLNTDGIPTLRFIYESSLFSDFFSDEAQQVVGISENLFFHFDENISLGYASTYISDAYVKWTKSGWKKLPKPSTMELGGIVALRKSSPANDGNYKAIVLAHESNHHSIRTKNDLAKPYENKLVVRTGVANPLINRKGYSEKFVKHSLSLQTPTEELVNYMLDFVSFK